MSELEKRRFVKTLLIWLVPALPLAPPTRGSCVADLAGFFALAGTRHLRRGLWRRADAARVSTTTAGFHRRHGCGSCPRRSHPRLIMVNTFVGFLAGYNVEVAASEPQLRHSCCRFPYLFSVFVVGGAPLVLDQEFGQHHEH